MLKLWVDDVRPAPDDDYMTARSVREAKELIVASKFLDEHCGSHCCPPFRFQLIDMDHDAGDFAEEGGDYIELLKWLEETGRDYPVRIHSMNPVGVANMRRIIERNGWTEVR